MRAWAVKRGEARQGAPLLGMSSVGAGRLRLAFRHGFADDHRLAFEVVECLDKLKIIWTAHLGELLGGAGFRLIFQTLAGFLAGFLSSLVFLLITLTAGDVFLQIGFANSQG